MVIVILLLTFSCETNNKNPICTLKINADSVLFATTSYVIGVNRNHISKSQDATRTSPDHKVDKSENIEAELIKYRQIRPEFSSGRKLYRLGHGPTDGRLDFPHDYMKGYHFMEWWNKASYPYDDIRYGLQEAELMNADVTMVINYGTGTPGEAGTLVSYLNNKNDLLRNARGEPPWNVRYFEIGNEVSWRDQRGHNPYCMSASAYASRAKEFATAMRQNSDIPIKIGLVASINGSFINDNWSNDESDDCMHDIDTLVQIMKDDIDFIIFHDYPSFGSGAKQIMAQNAWLQNKIEKKINPTLRKAEKKYHLSHSVSLANSEFNSGRYHSARKPDVLEAMYAADNIITALNNQLVMAVSFCFSSHGFQNMMFYQQDTMCPTPVYSMQSFLAEHLGDSVVFCRSYHNSFFTADSLVTSQVINDNLTAGLGITGTIAVGKLAYVCTKKNEGSIDLLILNRTEENQAFRIELSGSGYNDKAKMYILNGGSYLAVDFILENSEAKLGEVLHLPGASVAVIEIEKSVY